MNELEKTYSVCPMCFYEGKLQKIDANIIEDEGKIWIKKHCKNMVILRKYYFGDVELYKRWMSYKVTAKPVSYVKTKLLEDPELYDDTYISNDVNESNSYE